MRTTRAPKQPSSRTSNTPHCADIEAMITQIRKDQAAINAKQSEAVPLILGQARRLAALRATAKGTWIALIERAGINARVARRYLRVARAAWLPEGGLPAAEVLNRLPGDLEKLDALAQLDGAQLRALLAKCDPRAIPRPDLVAAVREARGAAPTRRSPVAAERVLTGALARFQSTVERAFNTIATPEQQQKCITQLRARFNLLLTHLEGRARGA